MVENESWPLIKPHPRFSTVKTFPQSPIFSVENSSTSIFPKSQFPVLGSPMAAVSITAASLGFQPSMLIQSTKTNNSQVKKKTYCFWVSFFSRIGVLTNSSCAIFLNVVLYTGWKSGFSTYFFQLESVPDMSKGEQDVRRGPRNSTNMRCPKKLCGSIHYV